MSEAHEKAEKEIREAFDAEDYERAATLVIQHYGREILGFLGRTVFVEVGLRAAYDRSCIEQPTGNQ